MSWGPKYYIEPNEGPVGHVAMVRKVVHEATHEEKERCISEGVRCLFANKSGTKCKPLSVKKAIDFLRDERLALLKANKEGGFVVMPLSVYEEKASQALGKIFVAFRWRKTPIKREQLTGVNK